MYRTDNYTTEGKRIISILWHTAFVGVRTTVAARTRLSRFSEAREAGEYESLEKLGAELAEAASEAGAEIMRNLFMRPAGPKPAHGADDGETRTSAQCPGA